MEELNDRIRIKSQDRDAIVAELKALTAERNALEAQQNAENLLSGMSEQQKDALHQMLGVDGVKSTTQVGSS